MKIYFDPRTGCHRVMKPRAKKTPNGYLVWPADFYDGYCGEPQTVEVDEKVYFCMMTAYWEEKRFPMSVDRHHIPIAFDEILMGELWNVATDATDELCFAHLRSEELLNAVMQLDAAMSRRVYLRYIMEMNLAEIAAMEGVSTVAICKSLQRAIESLRKTMCDSDEK